MTDQEIATAAGKELLDVMSGQVGVTMALLAVLHGKGLVSPEEFRDSLQTMRAFALSIHSVPPKPGPRRDVMMVDMTLNAVNDMIRAGQPRD